MADDTLAAELAGISRRARQITDEHGPDECDLNGESCTGHDAERLVKAIQAALAPHEPGRRIVTGSLCERHETHRFFSITATEAADVTDCRDCTATVYASCRACGDHVRLDACPVREAVASALTGEPDDSRPAPSAPPGSSETEGAYVLRRMAETAASLPLGAPLLTGAERDALGEDFRREYREARRALAEDVAALHREFVTRLRAAAPTSAYARKLLLSVDPDGGQQ